MNTTSGICRLNTAIPRSLSLQDHDFFSIIKEKEDDFPAIHKINQEILGRRQSKKEISDILSAPRDVRLEKFKQNSPEFYTDIRSRIGIEDSEKFGWFLVRMGKMAGTAALLGTALLTFGGFLAGLGIAAGIGLSILFPVGAAVLSVALQRPYQDACMRGMKPGREDRMIKETLQDIITLEDEALTQLEKEKEHLLLQLRDRQQDFIDSIVPGDPGGNELNVDENYIDIDGIKLVINKTLGGGRRAER